MVISTLLYGCETWTCYRKNIKKLERFHQTRLRLLLKIKWQDMIPDTEVLTRSKQNSIEANIIKHRLRWSGHVMRMGETRLPRMIFLSKLSSGERGRGRPLLRYKDMLKKTLKDCNISEQSLVQQGDSECDPISIRNNWREGTHKGVEFFEAKRIEKAQEKRAIRERKTLKTPTTNIQLTPSISAQYAEKAPLLTSTYTLGRLTNETNKS